MAEGNLARIKFRASSVGNLLVGGNAITSKQLARLEELEARSTTPSAKPLTANMQQELEELWLKRDGEFVFGATAMSYIRSVWLRNEFNYEEPIVSHEMIKGIQCEDEAIGVLSRQVPGGFRVKNEDSFADDWFTGTPDVILDEVVEDTKVSWTLRTFVETQKPDPIYYAQGQVYMALTGRQRFRVVYVLVPTPFEIVEEEKKRFFFKFNCDEQNPHYLKAIEQVDAMHNAVNLISESQRIRVFEFDRNEQYLETLRLRVEQARKVYDSLTLEGWISND